MKINIKRLLILSIFTLCPLLTACSAKTLEVAVREVDDIIENPISVATDVISEVKDHYTAIAKDAVETIISAIDDKNMEEKKKDILAGIGAANSLKKKTAKKIEGIEVLDSGDVVITFRVPDGLTIERVLNSNLGSVTQNSINGEYVIRSAPVKSGGEIFWLNGIYEYYPSGTNKIVYERPGRNGVLDPKNMDLLEETYGIKLYLDGSRPTENVKSSGKVQSASEFEFKNVRQSSGGYGFQDGRCIVNGSYIVDMEGNVVEGPTINISNFCNGTAAAAIDDDSHADALIDSNGNVIWSIKVDGWKAAEQYFKSGEVVGIGSEFVTVTNNIWEQDFYHGYLIICFKLESYEFSGESFGVLDWNGNWIIKPGEHANYVQTYLGEYALLVDQYMLEYENGKVYDLSSEIKNAHTPAGFAPYNVEIFSAIEIAGYFKDHNDMKYSSSERGFLNENGEMVLMLPEEYKLVDESLEFVDGYALVNLENNRRVEYITVIDLNGNQMFDPIKCFHLDHGELSEGKFFVKNDDEGYFMDVYGNRVGEYVGRDYVDFHEGLGWIETSDGWICIDLVGDKAF